MTTFFFILSLIVPSTGMTVDQLEEFQNRAEAARRLQIGDVLQPGVKLAAPYWALSPTVDFADSGPFAEDDAL
jgi:hypothetical protein